MAQQSRNQMRNPKSETNSNDQNGLAENIDEISRNQTLIVQKRRNELK
jgi:hypothetical protein